RIFCGWVFYGAGLCPFGGRVLPAVDSRLFVIAGRNQPILDWAAFEFVELPAEDILVKRLHRLWVVSVNFKVSYTIHFVAPSFSSQRERSTHYWLKPALAATSRRLGRQTGTNRASVLALARDDPWFA